ncbi:MAG: DUF433 domain-containing protein [Methanosarcinaceae archaeon]
MQRHLIQSDPAMMMVKPVIAGMRITLELILEKLAAGESIEQIIAEHTRLTEKENIRAALDLHQVHCGQMCSPIKRRKSEIPC